MTRKPNSVQQLPTKWLVAIVGVLIVYGLTQPMLNSRLGWSLPSVASLLGQEKSNDANSGKSSAGPKVDAKGSEQAKSGANASKSTAGSDKITFPSGPSSKSGAKSSQDTDNPSETTANSQGSSGDLLFGLLKETSPRSEDYLSPQGLRYTRGSAEGHRLKHLERHLGDQPTRPGKHGVFYGDMPQVLRWLDDAYERGKRGAKGTSKRKEDNRTVFEVPFDKPVGYIGGRDGKRDGNPDAKRIRMVVEGDALITAFPF